MTDKDSLDMLTDWAISKGYSVDFDRRGHNCICYETKIIEINNTSSLRDQVFYLLHECGHVLIFENGFFWDFNIRNKYHVNEPEVEADNRKYKIFTVAEEIEAWQRGYRLAKKLNIRIDKSELEEYMHKAIKKYLKWASS